MAFALPTFDHTMPFPCANCVHYLKIPVTTSTTENSGQHCACQHCACPHCIFIHEVYRGTPPDDVDWDILAMAPRTPAPPPQQKPANDVFCRAPSQAQPPPLHAPLEEAVSDDSPGDDTHHFYQEVNRIYAQLAAAKRTLKIFSKKYAPLKPKTQKKNKRRLTITKSYDNEKSSDEAIYLGEAL